MKRLFYYCLLVLTLIIIFISISNIYLENIKDKETIILYQKINKIANNKPNYLTLLKQEHTNPDIVAYLSIPNLFNTVLVKGSDNKYYLNHLINKEKNEIGAIFIDYRSDIENGSKINIYGHNSKKYDIPFKKLESFLDEEFFLKNKYLYLETENNKYKYEILSVKVVSNDASHMDFTYNNFLEHVNKIKEKSLYTSNLTFLESDKLLTLQTCLFNNSLGKYLLVNYKRI